MPRLPLRSISGLPGLLSVACVVAGVAAAACGDASVTSAQNWQNASPVVASTSTENDAGSTTTSTGDDSAEDAAAAAADDAEATDAETTTDATTDAGLGTESLTLASTMSTATIDLMSTTKVPVTITPSTGFTGMATLSVTGLPADVTGTFDSSTVSLASGMATANLTLTSLSSTVIQANSYSIVATPAGGTPSTLAAKVTVNPKITIHLPLNLESTIATSKLNNGNPLMITAPANLSATNPISVVMHNDDTTDYFEIHVNGSGSAGFVHGVQAIAPESDEAFGTSNPRVINAKTTVNFYMHGFGTTASAAAGGMGGGSTDFPGSITVQ